MTKLELVKTPRKFGGTDVFLLAEDEVFPDALPSHIHPIEERTLIPVDLESMTLTTVGERETKLRMAEIENHLIPATSGIFYAVVLHALNGNRKVGTVVQWVSRFKRMLTNLKAHLPKKVATITLQMILVEDQRTSPNDAKTLRAFLKYWSGLKFPGLAPDLKDHIKRSRSPKAATPIEIQSTNPRERPYSLEKVRDIHRSVDDLYIAGDFNPQENLLWKLLISEALRPSQLQILRVGDVTTIEESGTSFTELMVPMVKQHGVPARSKMIPVYVSDSVSVALRDQLDFIRSLQGTKLRKEQPLFCVNSGQFGVQKYVQEKALRIIQLIVRTRTLIARHAGDLEDLDLFSRRFKHTKLTHLAMLGANTDVLAHAAFHKTRGSLHHYTNLSPEAMDDYERRMDSEFKQVVAAFRGELVAPTDAAAVTPQNYIMTKSLEGAVGGCKSNPCGVLAPFACYGCSRFQAFDDGPHVEVLNELEENRERAVAMGLPEETIRRDDELIAACRQVIAQIAERENETA